MISYLINLYKDFKPLIYLLIICFLVFLCFGLIEEVWMEKKKPTAYLVYTLDAETAVGEMEILRDKVEDMRNREAWESVREGRGDDYERASQYERDHCA